MENIYFNFFSIGAMIPVLFAAYATSFLFRVSDKSPATRNLMLYYFWLTIFYGCYFWPAGVWYHPDAAFHRWGTVGFVFVAGIFLIRFFFRFPTERNPRVEKALVIGFALIALVTTANFIRVTLSAERIYKFEGHLWDFSADEVSRYTGLVIMSMLVSFYILGFWRTFTSAGPAKWPVLLITLGLMITTLVPGILNILSHQGNFGREIYQTWIDLCAVAGNFMVLVVYINSTRDRTTFMTKIVGISLATFLLVLQFVSFLALNEKENAYDELKAQNSRLVLENKERPADLRYIKVFDIGADDLKFQYKADGVKVVKTTGARVEYRHAAMREKLLRLNANDFDAGLERLLNNAHPRFAGYAAALRAYAKGLEGKEKTGAELARFLDENQRAFRVFRLKFAKMPARDFAAKAREALEKQSKKEDRVLGPMAGAVLAAVKDGPADPAQLRKTILEYLTPVRVSGSRLYRESTDQSPGEDKYTAFLRIGPDANRVYEVGYSYLAYRLYIHPWARTLMIILLIVMVIVILGFRVFFYGALVQPLNTLLEGVERVNVGDLTVKVPVKVQDEVGFLSESFNSMVATVRDARENLEQKVADRTAELSETLTRVQALKDQQDGDYFLTSLLIKPLGANHVEGGDVSVDFFVRQKKSFKFRQWEEEIGGDLNKAHRIKLHGKPHTVFLNADAMGKSIQGAGGVLVLGSVFESLLERTRLSSAVSDQYPERWMKNAFIELQKVFESFNGSMLVSLVIGLVDEESGIMYYINAEHPFTVLYRSGKAKFIESELTFRKLGTPGMDGTLHVRTLQLKPGDVIIAGSDGRDDILLGRDEKGNRIINEDDLAFLKRVEEGEGELDGIHQALMRQGELTDDLALLRVGYRDNHALSDEVTTDHNVKEMLEKARELQRAANLEGAIQKLEAALELDNRRPEVIYEMIRIRLDRKEYPIAAAHAEDYIYLRPGDTDMVYVASVCFRRAGDLGKAADLGERVRLREPHLVKNLTNLARVYAQMGNLDRANMLLDDALQFEPDHEAATKLRIQIAEQKSAAS